MNKSRGILIVLAGPSGAGKTTLAHYLVDSSRSTVFSISTTTRTPRGPEVDGVDYCFVDRKEFERRLKKGYFLEWADVHGHMYGTSEKWVSKQLAGGMNVVLDIDVQGALQVKAAFPESVLIFILPTSPEILGDRLLNRSTDKPDIVLKRMKAATWETGWIGSFDYYIQNDRLEDSLRQVEAILKGEKSRLVNMPFPEEVRAFEPERFQGREYWVNRKIIVTSGSTREPLDDIRFISNRSSGLMGSCMAGAFRDAGAEVLFVTGPSCNMNPPGVDIINITTADDMLRILLAEVESADLLVMTAAVSDFRPSSSECGKIKRSGKLELYLKATPDILATLNETVKGMCPVLAFSLEMGEHGKERAVKKMKRKGACAVFFNRGDIPGTGMEATDNEGLLIFEDGSTEIIKRSSKRYITELAVAAMGRYMISREGK